MVLLFLQEEVLGWAHHPPCPHAAPRPPPAPGAEPGRLSGTRKLCSEPPGESYRPLGTSTVDTSGQPPPSAGPGQEGAGPRHTWLDPGWGCGHCHQAGLQAPRGRGTAAWAESCRPTAGQRSAPGADSALPGEGEPGSRVREGEETRQGAQETEGEVEAAQRLAGGLRGGGALQWGEGGSDPNDQRVRLQRMDMEAGGRVNGKSFLGEQIGCPKGGR